MEGKEGKGRDEEVEGREAGRKVRGRIRRKREGKGGEGMVPPNVESWIRQCFTAQPQRRTRYHYTKPPPISVQNATHIGTIPACDRKTHGRTNRRTHDDRV